LDTLATTSDEELLAAKSPEALGVFYDRYARALLGYFARRTSDPEAAADLVAETFASAIVARRRFKLDGTPASAWLFTIAARRLADYRRRGHADRRILRSLAIERPTLSEEDADMIRVLADDATVALLADLPSDQREAVAGHVVDERDYADLAREANVSEAAVRQRVSRGLSALRRTAGRRP
jgi:RNA polymerase sigma-70 factor (ECF subfamily)